MRLDTLIGHLGDSLEFDLAATTHKVKASSRAFSGLAARRTHLVAPTLTSG